MEIMVTGYGWAGEEIMLLFPGLMAMEEEVAQPKTHISQFLHGSKITTIFQVH
jgi:hypothetical protein